MKENNTLSTKITIIIWSTVVLAAFGVCVALGYISLGEGGIVFNF